MSDLIDRQAAIDALMAWEEGSIWNEECLRHRGEPYWVAPSDVIENLPSAQSDVPDINVGDMKSCIYCHEDSDGYVTPIEKNCHAFIRFGMNGCELSLKAKGWHGSAKIKYCPMCGRRLTDG